MKFLFFILALLLISPALSAEQGDQFIGYAYDLKTGELEYKERHRRVLDNDDNKLVYTDYVDANDKLIARRKVRYTQDELVEFEMSDILNQETVSAKRQGQKVVLKKQEANDPPTQQELALNSDTDNVIDAGFNDYVLKHWDSLISGEKKKFNFLSTERNRWIVLELKGVDERQTSGFTIRRFQMTVANPLIRLLMTPIKVEYYADTRELYRYEGISNLRRKNGKNHSVRIEFPREDYKALAQQP